MPSVAAVVLNSRVKLAVSQVLSRRLILPPVAFCSHTVRLLGHYIFPFLLWVSISWVKVWLADQSCTNQVRLTPEGWSKAGKTERIF